MSHIRHGLMFIRLAAALPIAVGASAGLAQATVPAPSHKFSLGDPSPFATGTGPSYAAGIVTCADGTKREWKSPGEPLPLTMRFLCRIGTAATSDVTPPVAVATPGKVDIAELLRETNALTIRPHLRQSTDDEIQTRRDTDDLNGNNGWLPRLIIALRLGDRNVLAYMAGQAFSVFAMIMLAWMVFFRESKR